MTDVPQRYATPKRIILATDLSGRCDRALDRAALLAAEWNARLIVVHALERDIQTALGAEHDVPSWRRDSAQRAEIAKRQIRDDLHNRDVPFEVFIEDGEPTDVILRAAAEFACDLIVTGTARSETFGRLILGTTVDRLVRRAPVPVLVVKARARQPYRKVMVGTDFSEASRAALEGAAEFFPQSAIVLFHRYRPAAGLLAISKAGNETAHQIAADDCAKFLAETALSEERRAALQILIESGSIEVIVKTYAYDKGLDLLVIGARGRNVIADLILGSTAEKMLASAPCDVLVMRKA